MDNSYSNYFFDGERNGIVKTSNKSGGQNLTPVFTGPILPILDSIKASTLIAEDMATHDFNLFTSAGAYVLDMQVDSKGIYHADFDCWQAAFGYNNFYDTVFDIFTDMDNEKFKFTYNGKSYMIWAWMTLHYTDPETGEFSNVFNYEPSDSQWWITGFDPKYQKVKAADLKAYFTIKFPNKEMYEAFNKMYGREGEKPDSRWTFLTPNGYFIHDYQATFKF